MPEDVEQTPTCDCDSSAVLASIAERRSGVEDPGPVASLPVRDLRDQRLVAAQPLAVERGQHQAALAEVQLTSSLTGDGIPALRTHLAEFAV